MWHHVYSVLELPLGRDAVFEFFSQAENLQKITPDSLGFEILTPLPIAMRQDTLIDYKIGLGPFPMKWRTLISVWQPPHEFVDEQIKGPYRTWIHRHRFEECDDGTRIIDYVRFELPLTQLGDIVAPLIYRQLRGIFEHRNRAVPQLLLGDRWVEAKARVLEIKLGLRT